MTKTASEIRRELKERRKKRKRTNWYGIKGGKTVYLRIGPPWKKDGEFWKDALFHGFYKNKVYCRKNDIDPKTGKAKKCPICMRLRELKTDRSPRGKKLWSLIKQNTEGLWNVLVAKKFKRVNGKVIVRKYLDGQFKVLRLSQKWQSLMMDIFGDEDYRSKSILGVTHSKYGRLIKAVREGEGRDDTTYSFRPVDHESPIFKDEDKRKSILKTLNDLDAIVHGNSKEECEAFLEKCEKKARIMAAEDKGKKRRDDDEDDEDDDERDDEEESEDEEEEGEEDSEDDDDDSDDEDSDDDDLEKKYKKMKKKLKKRRKEEDEEDDDE